MSVEFSVLPSDYVGDAGSTMPVRAELQGGEVQGCPIEETWEDYGVSGVKMTTDMFTIGSVTENADGSVTQSASYDFLTLPSSAVLDKISVVYTQDGNTNAKAGFYEYGNTSAIIVVYEVYANRVSLYWGGIIHTPTRDEYGGEFEVYLTFDNNTVTLTTSVGDSLVCPVQQSSSDIKYVSVRKNTLKSVQMQGQNLPNRCQGELETYNVELFDNLGVSRDTQVVVSEAELVEVLYTTADLPNAYTTLTASVNMDDLNYIYMTTSAHGELFLYGDVPYSKTIYYTVDYSLGGSCELCYAGIKGYTSNISQASTICQIGYSITSAYTDVKIGSVIVGYMPVQESVSSLKMRQQIRLELYLGGEYSIVVTNIQTGDTESFTGAITQEMIDSVGGVESLSPYTYISNGGAGGGSSAILEDLHFSLLVPVGDPKAEYIYDAENMQAVDTGEWKLVADGVDALFDVDITSLKWVSEPVDQVVELDSAVTVEAEVGGGEVISGCPVGETFVNYGVGGEKLIHAYYDFVAYNVVTENEDGSINIRCENDFSLNREDIYVGGEFSFSVRGLREDETWNRIWLFTGKWPIADNGFYIQGKRIKFGAVYVAEFDFSLRPLDVFTFKFTDVLTSNTKLEILIDGELYGTYYADTVGGTVKRINATTYPAVTFVDYYFMGFGYAEECTGEVLASTLELSDPSGAVIDTQTDIVSNYSYTIPSLGLSNRGLWSLRAFTALEEISSEFNLSIDAEDSKVQVQDVFNSPNTVDFTGNPTTGTNRLVTSYTVSITESVKTQDVYTNTTSTINQDIYK